MAARKRLKMADAASAPLEESLSSSPPPWQLSSTATWQCIFTFLSPTHKLTQITRVCSSLSLEPDAFKFDHIRLCRLPISARSLLLLSSCSSLSVAVNLSADDTDAIRGQLEQLSSFTSLRTLHISLCTIVAALAPPLAVQSNNPEVDAAAVLDIADAPSSSSSHPSVASSQAHSPTPTPAVPVPSASAAVAACAALMAVFGTHTSPSSVSLSFSTSTSTAHSPFPVLECVYIQLQAATAAGVHVDYTTAGVDPDTTSVALSASVASCLSGLRLLRHVRVEQCGIDKACFAALLAIPQLTSLAFNECRTVWEDDQQQPEPQPPASTAS